MEAKAVPIVLTAIYQVARLGSVTPYVGGGPSVMFATDEHVTNPQLTAVSQPHMSIAPAPGIVLQGGLDAKITNRIYARLDIKFIALMMARATVESLGKLSSYMTGIQGRRLSRDLKADGSLDQAE